MAWQTWGLPHSRPHSVPCPAGLQQSAPRSPKRGNSNQPSGQLADLGKPQPDGSDSRPCSEQRHVSCFWSPLLVRRPQRRSGKRVWAFVERTATGTRDRGCSWYPRAVNGVAVYLSRFPYSTCPGLLASVTVPLLQMTSPFLPTQTQTSLLPGCLPGGPSP